MRRRSGTLGRRSAAALACAVGSLVVAAPALASPSMIATPVAAFEAETMALSTSLGRVDPDAAASGGKNLLIWSNGAAAKSLTTSVAANRLTVRVRGSQCSGAPKMHVRIDGVLVFDGVVSATSYFEVMASVQVGAGAHKVTVAFVNDFRTSWCDRNLFVDNVALAAVTVLNPEPFPPPAGG